MTRRRLYRLVQQIVDGDRRREATLLDAFARPNGAVPQELRSLLDCDDALGQIYQAVRAPQLEAAYRATASQRRKFTDDEIPAVTQLFTPRWVVDFLVQNTLGRMWLAMHPDSALAATMPWLIRNPSALAPRRADSIRVLDPACGTMNFGLAALELLRPMYREEMDRAGRSGWPGEPSVRRDDQIDDSILRHNLIGIDIDPLALRLARATLSLKVGRELSARDVNLWQGDALFDAQIARRLSAGCDVIVTNPPYLSARNLPASRVRQIKQRFPLAWRDLYACFIQRAIELLRPDGYAGLLTMHSFMFTGSFEKLRRWIDESAAIEALAHFGPGLFDIGNPGTLQTAAFVLRKGCREEQSVLAFRLVEEMDEEAKRQALSRAIRDGAGVSLPQRDLSAMPRAAWVYWASESERESFAEFPRLGTVAPVRQGLATTDNARFVRYWWEIDVPPSADVAPTPGRWFPYAKGGRFARWYASAQHAVDWQDDGKRIKRSIVERYPYLNGDWQWVAKNSSWYGREGVTYSYLTSGTFSARLLERGTIFDVAGSSLFPDDPQTMLAVLNSSAARSLLSMINPTVNFQVGDVAQLPLPTRWPGELRGLVQIAIDLRRRIDSFDETTRDFARPMEWLNAEDLWRELHRKLHEVEQQIDSIVAEAYGMERGSSPAHVEHDWDRRDLAARWVSFAIRVYFAGEEFLMLDDAAPAIRRVLDKLAGEEASRQVEEVLGGLARYLPGDFLTWHARQYRRRPIYWALAGKRGKVLVPHWNATAANLRRCGVAVPENWQRSINDGIAINLAPLAASVLPRAMQKVCAGIRDQLAGGELAWSQTAASWSARRTRRASSPAK